MKEPHTGEQKSRWAVICATGLPRAEFGTRTQGRREGIREIELPQRAEVPGQSQLGPMIGL